jgi:hypothetical protein
MHAMHAACFLVNSVKHRAEGISTIQWATLARKVPYVLCASTTYRTFIGNCYHLMACPARAPAECSFLFYTAQRSQFTKQSLMKGLQKDHSILVQHFQGFPISKHPGFIYRESHFLFCAVFQKSAQFSSLKIVLLVPVLPLLILRQDDFQG